MDFGFGERRATVMTVKSSDFLVVSRKKVQLLMERGKCALADLPLHNTKTHAAASPPPTAAAAAAAADDTATDAAAADASPPAGDESRPPQRVAE